MASLLASFFTVGYPMWKTLNRTLDGRAIKKGSDQDSELYNLILFWMTYILIDYIENIYEIILSIHWLYWVIKCVTAIVIVKYDLLYLFYDSTLQSVFLDKEDQIDNFVAKASLVNNYVKSSPMANIVAIPQHVRNSDDSSVSSSTVSSDVDDEDLLEMSESIVPNLELKKNE